MMKTERIFLLLIFAFVFLISTSASAQKIAGKVTTSITLPDDFGNKHTFTGNGIEIYNLINGSFLRTVHIKVPLETLELFTFEPYANYLFVGFFNVDLDNDGNTDFTVYDSKIYINKSGNMSVSFHYNGAGKVIPRGY